MATRLRIQAHSTRSDRRVERTAVKFMRALTDVPAPPDADTSRTDPPEETLVDTVVLEYAPAMSDDTVLEHTPTKRLDPPGAMAFDFTGPAPGDD